MKTRAVEQGTTQWPAGVEIHHLIEQRFKDVLDVSADDIPGVVLTPSEHQEFTQAWRDAIGYNNQNSEIITSTATRDDIWAAAQKVYANHPEMLEYCRRFLGK